MKTKKLTNVFSEDEIKEVKNTIKETLDKSKINEFLDQTEHDQEPYNQYIYLNQGRKDLYHIEFSHNIIDKITKIANEMFEKDLFLCGVQYTEYVGDLTGNPTLGIHYDGGDVDFILDYQLESNHTWGIAIEEDVYEINDNELMLLRPVSNLHYRPIKQFDKNHYLKMIFFKFMEKNMHTYKSNQVSKETLNKINYIFENYYKGSK